MEIVEKKENNIENAFNPYREMAHMKIIDVKQQEK